MKRKIVRIIGISAGVLVLLIIILAASGPLLARMGVEPVCIQGEWPQIKVVPCQQKAPTVTALPMVSLEGQVPTPVIFDDDGSPDGTLALLYLLRTPSVDVRAVTISPGEAHPALFTGQMKKFLEVLGREDIPVAGGRETPLEGKNVFPDPWRQASDNFWGIVAGSPAPAEPNAQAAQLIVDTINRSEQPVLMFISGTHTNLAEALRLDPGIAENIGDVFIMGGNIYVPGNINSDWPENENKVAEWNIWVDPTAADEIFASGLPLHLVPLDATRQVIWTEADLESWETFNSPESSRASELLQWMLESWSPEGVYIWDLVAAVQAINPRVCNEVKLGVDIETKAGAEQGKLLIDEAKFNTSVCLDPDADQVKAIVASILADR